MSGTAAPPSVRPGAGFRIATFNVESLGLRTGAEAPLEMRVDVLREHLARLDADILCLQEVDAEETRPHEKRVLGALDRLLAGTPYAAFHRVAMTSSGGVGPADRHNLVVLSRYTVAASRQIWHELVPPLTVAVTGGQDRIEARFDRPIQYAALALPAGRSLHVVNLHLKAPLAATIPGQKLSAFVWKSVAGWAEGYYLAALKRNGQALEARLFIDGLFDAEPDALIAVCGDFNADHREVPARIILGSADDTGNPAVAARAMTALEQSLPRERRYSVVHAGEPVMLDHILVSRGLAGLCRRAEVFNQGLPDEVLDAPAGARRFGSFHAPVLAAFALPP
ncbi:MAG: endonuclease/exonuclease/phosphatase family protein [Alphaproteobacteria bacterium]|nr:endonuclease/exonuclease/phosphatase family protein [Alphaproteobacteria bacterium]